jgi:hypothetical protein
MTSQINPNNIDGNYPVAGVPNNTQGFRDNFTNTKTNFQYAADEIDELQSKAVLKAALDGTVLDNNMNYNIISQVQTKTQSFTEVTLTQTSGSVNLDFSAGMFQAIPGSSGAVSLSFSNWPAAGQVGVMRFAFVCTNAAHTLTFPASVRVGVEGLQGVAPGTAGVSNTVTFEQTTAYNNVYIYEFSTADSGTQIAVTELTRPRDVFDGPVKILDTTASTSKTTGALIVAGGAGIGGNLNVGGNLRTYTSGGNIAFQADTNGFVTINAPTVPANTTGALQVVGSSGGAYQPILNQGGMIHITGNDGVASRITNDAFGAGATAYPLMVQRRGRGTAASPTAVQNGDILARYGGTGYGNVGYVLAAGNIATNTIDFVALENYTTANGGSSIQFYTSTIGAVNRTLSANVTANVTTFPGNVVATNVNSAGLSLSGNVVSAFNVTANIAGGNIRTAGLITATGNITGGNIVTTANVTAGNILVSGSSGIILSDGGTMGYGAGAGGVIAQSGNKTQTVILNKPSGEITMQNTNLAADTTVSFTLTNSTIANHDVLIMNIVGGVATAAAYNLDAVCNTGSAVISVRNITAGTLGESIVLRFAVIKGAIA